MERHRPLPLTSEITESTLVGRESLIRDLERLILDGETRVIGITGTAGVGKSRIARELARILHPAFPTRTLFVDLANLQDSRLFPTILLDLIGIDDPMDPRSIIERCRDWIDNTPTLLIADDATPATQVVNDLNTLIDSCPALTVVTTSRNDLGLHRAHRIVVPPLAITVAGGDTPPHEDLMQHPAIQLYVERARRVAPGIRLTPETSAEIARVCQMLGGLPLAIELAASRSALYSPLDLLRLGDESIRAIDPENGSAGDGQRTIRAALDWSFQRISPASSRAAGLLCVFPGGFTRTMASVLGLPADLVISELIDHHLVQALEQENGERRFAMHPMVRQFALEHLEQQGNADWARKQFVSVMRDFALATPLHSTAAITLVYTEQANLRHALHLAIEGGRIDVAALLFELLEGYWISFSRLDEVRVWTERLARKAIEDEQLHHRIHAITARIDGHMRMIAGDLNRSRQLLDESLSHAEATGDQRLIMRSLLFRGTLGNLIGDVDIAQTLLNRARTIADEIDDPYSALEALREIGTGHLLAEAFEPARDSLERALEEARDLGDRRLIVGVLHSLGYAFAFHGDLDAARAAVAESSALYGSEGQRSRASIIQAAARIEILAGDLGAAADYAVQVLNLASTLGDAPLLRAAFTDAGAILELAGHHAEASYALGAGRAEILCSRPVTRMSAPACDARDRVIAVLGNARYRSHYRNGAIAPTKEAVITTVRALEEFLAAPDPPRPKDLPATGADLGLTARELDVLHELARGRSNVEIAAQLYITQETVKSHVRKILRKLGVSSRSAAVGVAFRAGIVGKDGPGTA